MIHVYILLYLALGFTLGCFQYFRNKLRNIGGIAELVAIMLVWPILGVIYIVHELIEDQDGDQNG